MGKSNKMRAKNLIFLIVCAVLVLTLFSTVSALDFVNITDGFSSVAVGGANVVAVWGNATHLFLPDTNDAKVYIFWKNGTYVTSVSSIGGIRALCGDDTTWYELPIDGATFTKYNAGTGTSTGSFTNGANAEGNGNVEGMYCNSTDIYISDYADATIYHVLINGTYVNKFPIPYTNFPQGLYPLNSTHWLIVDQGNGILYLANNTFASIANFTWSSIVGETPQAYGLWSDGFDFYSVNGSGAFVYHIYANNTNPKMDYISPTLTNNSNKSQNWIYVNVSLATNSFYNITFFYYGNASWPSDNVAYYRFEENGGSVGGVINDSTRRFNGTIYGGAFISIPGKINNTLNFNGTSVINLTATPFNYERTDNFSVSLWVKMGGNAGNHAWIEKSDSTAKGWAIARSGDAIAVAFVNNWAGPYNRMLAYWFFQNNSITTWGSNATWYHIVMTYDGTSNGNVSGVNLYINGVLRNNTGDKYWSATTDTLTGSMLNTAAKASIGSRNLAEFFSNDTFDEFGIWNKTLTSEEVLQLYNSGNGQYYNAMRYPINNTTYLVSTTYYNITGLSEGSYYYNVETYDSYNLSGITETRTITLDGNAPRINYTSPTENNNSNKSQNWIYVNVSVTDINLKNITYQLGTNNTGAVLYYRFEETSGQVVTDSVARKYNGNLTSGATQNQACKVGQCYLFGGEASPPHLLVNPAPQFAFGPPNYSISFWMKNIAGGDGASQRIIQYGDGATYFVIALEGATENLTIYDSVGGTWTTSLDPILDTWYHIVYVQDSGTEYVYVNGTELTHRTQTRYITPGYFYMGSVPSYDRNFAGYLDEFAIWNKALSASEVATLYNNSSGYIYNAGFAAGYSEVPFTTTNTTSYNWTGLPNGRYYYNVTAYDTYNNSNTTETRWITLDTGAPSINQTYPPNGSFMNESTINFTWTLNDSVSGIKNTTIYVYQNGSIQLWGDNLNNGLLYYYKLDAVNGSGFTLDDVDNNNVEVIASTTTVTGKINYSQNFSGASSARFATGPINNTGNFTVAFWFKANALGPNPTVLDARSKRQFTIEAATVGMRAYIGGASYVPMGSVTLSTWEHWVISFNGTTVKAYKNGISTNNTTATIASTSETTYSWLGQQYDNSNRVNGAIDELAFWDRSLNDSEIALIYNEGLGLTHNGTGEDYILFNNTTKQSYELSDIFNTIIGIPITLTDGLYQWFVDAFDFADNYNYTSNQTITIDTTYPQIIYNSATSENATNASRNWIAIGVDLNETNLANITYSLYNATLNSGLVVYWNFDETSGNLIDRATGTWNGTNAAGVTQNIAGKVNNSYDYDGTSNAYTTIGDLDINTSLTISVWVNGTWTVGGFNGILVKPNDEQNSYIYSIIKNDGNKFQFRIWTSTGSKTLQSTTTPTDNVWYHIVGVFDDENDQMRIYINGVNEANLSSTGTINVSNANLWFGRIWTTGAFPMDGLIDEAGIWNRTLSYTEIQRLYNNGVGRGYEKYIISSSNNTTYTNVVTFINFTGLPNGIYLYNVTIIDLINQQNTTETRWITLDTAYPNITQISPANDTYTNNSTVNFTWQVNDSLTGIANTTLYIYNYTDTMLWSILNNDLKGYWKFDEASGSTAYDVKLYNNITLLSGTFIAGGVINNSINFSAGGGGSFTASLTDEDPVPSTGAFSISWWAKPSTIAVNYLEHWDMRSSRSIEVNQNADGILRIFNSTTTVVSTPISANIWTHFVVVFNGSHVFLYKNGTLVNSTGTNFTTTHETTFSWIGQQYDGSYKFEGALDEMGVWNRTLTPSEIIALYNNGSSVYYNASLNYTTSELYNQTTKQGYELSSIFNSVIGIPFTLVDGLYNWFVDTFDFAGNYNSTVNETLFIDTIVPTINFTTPTENNTANKSQTWIYVNVTVNEINEANITFSLYKNDSVSIILYNNTTYTDNRTYENFTSLADGLYYYNVTITDITNNQNSTDTRQITLDTANPSLTKITPLNGTYINSSNVTFNLTANDSVSGLYNLTIHIYSNVSDTQINYSSDNLSIYSLNTLINYLTLNDGEYNWSALAYDFAGNYNLSSNDSFVVDTVYPLINYTTPTEANASNVSESWVYINVTKEEINEANITFRIYNGTLTNLLEGLTNYYRFEEESGTTLTDSRDSQDGTLSNGWTLNQTAIVGKGWLAGGEFVTPLLSVPTSGYTSNFSIAFWMRKEAGGDADSQRLIQGVNGNGFTMVAEEAANNSFSIYGGDGSIWYSPFVAQQDVWYYVVYVHNGTTDLLYINGTLNSTFDTARSITDTSFYLGSRGSPTYRTYAGMLDELGFWNRTLSASEVSELFNSGAGLAYPSITGIQLLNNTTYTDGRTYINFTNLADGTYYYNVTVTDFANHQNSTDTRWITLDAASPTVTLITPSVHTHYNYSNITFIYHANDSTTGLVNSTIYIIDRLSEIIVFNNTTAYETLTFDSSITAYVNLSDGDYNWTASAWDYAGNYYEAPMVYIAIDTVSPDVNILYPEEGFNYSSVTSLNWSIVHDLSSLDTCWYSTDNLVTNITFNCNTTNSTTTNLTLVQGGNTWYVFANDTTNNLGYDAHTFTYDTSVPLINQTLPSNGSYTNETNINFTWILNDSSSGVQNTTVYVYNATNGTLINQTTKQSYELSDIFNTIVGIPMILLDGVYNWFVDVFDFAGNYNVTTNETFYINTAAPQINFSTGIVSNHTNISATWIFANVTISDSTPYNLTFTLYNSTNGSIHNQTIYTNLTNTTAQINWTNLPNGHYSYIVSIIDSVNYTNDSGIINITLDTVAPRITKTYPSNESYLLTTLSTCYQETANVSTACGGASNGTYLENVSGASAWLQINYTKPIGANAAIWQVKHGNLSIYNITILDSCFNYQTDKVSLRFYSRRSLASSNSYGECLNATGWNTITETATQGVDPTADIGSSISLLYDGDWDTYAYHNTGGGWWISSNPVNNNAPRVYEEGIFWLNQTNVTMAYINTSNVTFNFTVNDPTSGVYNLTLLLYNNSSGALINNTTWIYSQINITNNVTVLPFILADGRYQWDIATYDFANNFADPNDSFIVDTTYPLINFTTPTENNNVNKSQNWIYMNVTVNETNEANITFSLYNNNSSLCYQETSTNATPCGGLTGGSYVCGGSWDGTNGCDKTYDGLWTTFGYYSFPFGYVTVTYEKPVNAQPSSFWRVLASGVGDANITIPETCWNYNDSYLKFILQSSGASPLIKLTCYNDTGGLTTLYSGGGLYFIYEEAMYWNISSINLYNNTTYTDNRTYENFTLVPNGIYYYNVTVTDLANNQNSTETRRITLDTVSPQLNQTYPPNNTYTTNTNVTFNWTLNDTTSGIQNTTIYIYQNNSSVIGGFCYQEYSNISTSCGGLNTGGYYTADSWTTQENLYDGNYSTSTSCDGVFGCGGTLYINYSLPSRTIICSMLQFKIGNGSMYNVTIPVDCLNDPVQISWYAFRTAFGFDGTEITCYNGTTWVELYSAGSDGSQNLDDIYEESMFWSVPGYTLYNETTYQSYELSDIFNTLVSFPITLTNGIYQWFVDAWDFASNYNYTSNYTLTIDTADPEYIYFVSPTKDNSSYEDADWIYAEVVYDTYNLANITFNLYNYTSGGLINNTTYYSFGGTNDSVNWTGIANGKYLYNVTAIKLTNGNNSTETRWITLDTINPLINYSSGVLSNNTNITNTWIYINVTVNETNQKSINFTLYRNGILYTYYNNSSLLDYSLTSYDYNFTSLIDGNYLYNVTITDQVNRTNTTPIMNITLDSTAPNITIDSPVGIDYAYINGSIDLNFTITDINLASCWYYYNGTNTSISCTSGVAGHKSLSLNGTWVNMTNNLFIFYANDTFGNLNSQTIYYYYKALENARYYNSSTYETDWQSYTINVNQTGNASVTANFSYGGTEYITTKVGTNYGAANFTVNITVPVGVTNRSMYWKFFYTNVSTQTLISNTSNQTTNLTLLFMPCNATSTTPYANITFYDETSSNALTATINQMTWVYWLSDSRVNKTFIFSNDTWYNYNYTFCAVPNNRTFYTALTGLYYEHVSTGGADPNYPQRIYTNSSITLTNSSLSTFNLPLLASTDGQWVQIVVADTNGLAISGVDVIVTRQISGIETVLGHSMTDASGSVTFFLSPSFPHTFYLSKEDCSNLTSVITPTLTSYVLTMACAAITPTSPGNTSLEGIRYWRHPLPGILTATGNTTFAYYVDSFAYPIERAYFTISHSNGTIVIYNQSDADTIFCNQTTCFLTGTYNVQTGDHLKGAYYVDVGTGYILLDKDADWKQLGVYTDSPHVQNFFTHLDEFVSNWNDVNNCPDYNTQAICEGKGCIWDGITSTCSVLVDCTAYGITGNETQREEECLANGCYYETATDTCFNYALKNRQEFSRFVLVFLGLAIILAVFGRLTGYDAQNPGIFLIFLTVVVLLGSFSQGLAGPGYFYYSDLTPWAIVNNWIFFITTMFISLGYWASTVRRQT